MWGLGQHPKMQTLETDTSQEETKKNKQKPPNRKVGRKTEEAGKDSNNKGTKTENRKGKKKIRQLVQVVSYLSTKRFRNRTKPNKTKQKSQRNTLRVFS